MSSVVEVCDLTMVFEKKVYRGLWSFQAPYVLFRDFIGRLTGSTVVERVVALDGVSFRVGRGEIFGVLGPNGSGKSTLLKILAGLLIPTGGSVFVLGHDVSRESAVVARKVSLITSIVGAAFIVWSLSVRRNLELLAELYGVSKSRVDEVLSFTGLREVEDTRVGFLSTGTVARLIVAAGLLKNSELLLMDEPMMGVSAEFAVKFRGLVRRLNRELGTTIIYATNNLVEAQELCDRVAILDRGKLVVCGRPEDLIKSLGKSEVIEVEVANAREDIVEKLKELDGVVDVNFEWSDSDAFRMYKGNLRIRVWNAREVLPRILEVLIRRFDAEVRSIEVFKPNLLDVFLHYTSHVEGREGR